MMASDPGRPDLNVSLAEAVPGDLGLLVGYMSGLRADDPFPVSAANSEQAARAAIADFLADPALGHVWLIRVEGSAVGYVVLTLCYSIEFGGRCGFIDELYIEPTHRGRGVGRRALELVEAAARRLGVRVLLLEVSTANQRAHALYRSAGFAERKYQLMTKQLA